MASRVWTLPLVRRLFLHSPALTSCRSLTPVSSCSQRYVNEYRGELEAAIAEYERYSFTQLYRRDSRTIQAASKRCRKKVYNPDIKFAEVSFSCIHGGKTFKSNSKGVRPNTRTFRKGCPTVIKVRASEDGQRLVIKEMVIDHNHDISETAFKHLPRQRRMSIEEQETVAAMLSMHANKKLLQDQLMKDTGKVVLLKDLNNVSSAYKRANDAKTLLQQMKKVPGLESSVHQCRSIHTASNLLQEAVQNNEAQTYEFQAETRMLLDIVAKSLYSEKEVFLRELISNASDAIEKARYLAVQGKELDSSEADMKIHITTDKYDKTLTIQDSGIGMTKEELVDNLGTIARSGSKAFIQQLQEDGGADPQSIIGQFGVGFYSAFMVAERVDVFTKSRVPGSVGYRWSSDGSGKYTIEESEGVEPGTKIVCHLKLSNREFADEQTVKDVIKKYSSFIGSSVEVNGEQANNIKPIWLMNPKEVSPDQHDEFYRYVGSAYDKPRFVLHYHTDAPLDLRCVLYVPEGKPGLFDLNRDAESRVSLYCRRVLIMNKAENVLPKWLRFLKGVVDSEDIPLNLSRELLQDSALIRKLRTVIQNRVIRFLFDKSRKDPESYNKFFTDYGIFIKEGILSSQEQVEKEEIAKLIMYESSAKPSGEKVTLPEYIGRMADGQKDIYYLAAPSRELAETSPYFEALKKQNAEVLFCYEPYDEVVLMQLREFSDKKIVSVEKEMRKDKNEVNFEGTEGGLRRSQANELMDWLKTVLAGRCWGVKATSRLESHPCVVTVEEMGAARHFVRTQFTQIPEETRYSLLQPQLEINPNHPIIMKLNVLRDSSPRLAELTAKQLFNNAMVLAGLVEDPRTVLSSMNELLQLALEKH